MLDTAVILAGGFGTRLKTVVSDLPKPMAPVNGIPFLSYQFKFLQHYGIRNVVLSVGHLADKIESFYKQRFENLHLHYAHEKTPLGTGGGIRLALHECQSGPVLVLNGDSFFDVDLNTFYTHHQQHQADVSLALRQVNDAARYGTIQKNTNHRIVSFREKTNLPEPGIINGGLYILEKDSYLANTPANSNFSIEKDFFEKHLDQLFIAGFEFSTYFIDIGIPEDYAKAQHDFKAFKY